MCVTQVELDVTCPQLAAPDYRDVTHQKTAVVTFRLNADFRSWGLKSVDVAPFGTVTLPIFVKDFSGGKCNDREVVVEVDLAQCRLAYHSGDGTGMVTVTGLEVALTPEWKPDYNKSFVNVVR